MLSVVQSDVTKIIIALSGHLSTKSLTWSFLRTKHHRGGLSHRPLLQQSPAEFTTSSSHPQSSGVSFLPQPMNLPPQFTPLTEKVENVDNTHLTPYFPSKTLMLILWSYQLPKMHSFDKNTLYSILRAFYFFVLYWYSCFLKKAWEGHRSLK